MPQKFKYSRSVFKQHPFGSIIFLLPRAVRVRFTGGGGWAGAPKIQVFKERIQTAPFWFYNLRIASSCLGALYGGGWVGGCLKSSRSVFKQHPFGSMIYA